MKPRLLHFPLPFAMENESQGPASQQKHPYNNSPKPLVEAQHLILFLLDKELLFHQRAVALVFQRNLSRTHLDPLVSDRIIYFPIEFLILVCVAPVSHSLKIMLQITVADADHVQLHPLRILCQAQQMPRP